MPPSKKFFLFLLIANVLFFFYFLTTGRFDKIPMIGNVLSVAVLWGYVFKKVIAIDIKTIVTCVILFLLAITLRIYQLESLPPGMYGDEATIGVQSMKLDLKGEILPFVAQYSHPAPLLYAVNIGTKIFGPSVLAVRLPSIILGSLSVPLLFLFLRLFFSQPLSFGGALLLAFSYPHLVLSRLGYEPAAAIFFIIASGYFLKKYLEKFSPVSLLGLALSLSAGLYTYLSFRIFFVAIFLFIVFFARAKKQLFLFVAAIFIAASPLFGFSLLHPGAFWQRSAEISIIGQGLKTEEVVKEIGANIFRSGTMFGITGDPNPGKNPADAPVFDPTVSLLFVLGLYLLARKNRRWFFFTLTIAGAFFAADIFSIERIPEFHYYGLGHPNTLRVCGFIPLVIFFAVYSLSKIRHRIIVFVIIAVICAVNFYWYFFQKSINPRWYAYNFRFNQQSTLSILNFLNKNNISTVAATADISGGDHQKYFLARNTDFLPITATDSATTVREIQSAPIAAVTINEANFNVVKSATEYLEGERKTEFLFSSDNLGSARAIIYLNEAPSTLRSGYLLPTLRRKRNPSEAKNSSLSSPSLRSEYFAKGDKKLDN